MEEKYREFRKKYGNVDDVRQLLPVLKHAFSILMVDSNHTTAPLWHSIILATCTYTCAYVSAHPSLVVSMSAHTPPVVLSQPTTFDSSVVYCAIGGPL